MRNANNSCLLLYPPPLQKFLKHTRRYIVISFRSVSVDFGATCRISFEVNGIVLIGPVLTRYHGDVLPLSPDRIPIWRGQAKGVRGRRQSLPPRPFQAPRSKYVLDRARSSSRQQAEVGWIDDRTVETEHPAGPAALEGGRQRSDGQRQESERHRHGHPIDADAAAVLRKVGGVDDAEQPRLAESRFGRDVWKRGNRSGRRPWWHGSAAHHQGQTPEPSRRCCKWRRAIPGHHGAR